MKKIIYSLITVLALFVLYPTLAYADNITDGSFEGKDWYMTETYTFAIPMKEDFKGTEIILTAKIGYISECAGGVKKYYFDKMISYSFETNGDKNAYVEDAFVTFYGHFYTDKGSVAVSGNLTKKVPAVINVSPGHGIFRNMNYNMKTNLYVREDFVEKFGICVPD